MLLLIALTTCVAAASAAPNNVLYMICDDLRPQFNESYEHSFMSTPGIDRLSRAGTTFTRAYCQQAVCAASRNSFMTGRRPDTTHCYNFKNHFRQTGPTNANGSGWVPMPEYFKNAGYLTLGCGKTYHPTLPPNFDEPSSWSQVRLLEAAATCSELLFPLPRLSLLPLQPLQPLLPLLLLLTLIMRRT